VCGLCLNDGEDTARTILCKDQNKSNMCECTTCKVHYAVEVVDMLKCLPKCHFCRHNEKAPSIHCVKCTNQFIYTRNDEIPVDWICAECYHGGNTANVVSSVPVKEIVTTETLQKIMSSKSIWAVYHDVMNKNVSIPSTEYIDYWKKKPILNHSDVINSIEGWINEGKAEWGTCLACFSDMPKNKLQYMCKRKKCDVQVCLNCITAWYGSVQRGHIITIGNLRCAFCRQAPHVSILNKHNRELRLLQNIPKEWDHSWHYAWCSKCDNVKQCIERNCARETEWDASAVKNFVCEDCVHIHPDCKMAKTIITQDCPGCHVTTMKSFGCDHISCPCGVHWCFKCGQGFSVEEIYDHLTKKHGGYGFDEENDDNDDYFSDEEY